jgi:DNA-binding NarL/FixJ family response regulator
LLFAIAGASAKKRVNAAPPEELLYAIRCVHNGDAVVAPSTTRRLISRFLPQMPPANLSLSMYDQPPGLAELTAREREVLAKVGSGLSNTEIAALLHISEATVKTHVGHIIAKLSLRDRIQGVVYAYENGLIARNPLTSTISQQEQPTPARPDSRVDYPREDWL